MMLYKKTSALAIYLLVLASCKPVVANSSVSENLPSEILGTGLSLSIPTDLVRFPLGTTFSDSSGKTTLTIFSGNSDRSLENDPAYRALFPHAPETLISGSQTAQLYTRTRKQDGGAWDGYFFTTSQGDKQLAIQVSYMGESTSEFQALHNIFNTFSWRPEKVDTQQAFQATATTDLKLISGSMGGLAYSSDGTSVQAVPNILITALPVPPDKTASIFPANCQAAFDQAMGPERDGPHLFEQNGISGCDAWLPGPNGAQSYMAVLRRADGVMFSASGYGDPPQLRKIATSLKPL